MYFVTKFDLLQSKLLHFIFKTINIINIILFVNNTFCSTHNIHWATLCKPPEHSSASSSRSHFYLVHVSRLGKGADLGRRGWSWVTGMICSQFIDYIRCKFFISIVICSLWHLTIDYPCDPHRHVPWGLGEGWQLSSLTWGPITSWEPVLFS